MKLLTISFVIVILIGLFFFIYGLLKNSQLLILFGVMAFLAPIFYFIGWTPFIPFVALIALLISYIGRKRD